MPVSLSRASDTTASDLFVLAKKVFVDSNGAKSGNQALGANSAVIAQEAQVNWLREALESSGAN